MSSVLDLIAGLCPDGVDFVALEDVASLYGGLTGKTKKDFGHGDAVFVPYTNVFGNPSTDLAVTAPVDVSATERQRAVERGDVLFTGSSENLEEVAMSSVVLDEPLVTTYLNSFCFGLRWNRPVLEPVFAKHLFRSAPIRAQFVKASSGVTRFNVSKALFKKCRIPVPPIQVQREIAVLLDKMERLEADLRLELKAEVESRRKQHEHYRVKLFDFDGEVKWATLGETTVNFDAKRRPVTRSARVKGAVPYYGANGVQDYVADALFDGTFLLVGEDGSVMTKRKSPVVNWASGRIWVNNHAHVLQAADGAVNLRFLFHWLQIVDVSPFVTGGTQPKLNQRNLNAIPVPVVGRELQDRVASTLDDFGEVVEESVKSLNSEVISRRKQYEYYCNLLLTFAEKTA